MNPLRTRLAATALGAGIVLAAPAAAWAGPFRGTSTTVSSGTPSGTATIDQWRTRCLAAIDGRLPALSANKSALAANQQVTAEHRQALNADLDDTSARLETLRTKIAADTDLAALRQDCRSIFGDNRVYALVLPRTRMVVAADVADAAAGKLDQVAGKLDAAIAKAGGAGTDVTQATADLAAMRAKIDSGRSAAESVPGAVLGLTPADWNANHQVLQPARQSLQSARSDLRAARDLALKIRNELKP
jgi:hypothetical protein